MKTAAQRRSGDDRFTVLNIYFNHAEMTVLELTAPVVEDLSIAHSEKVWASCLCWWLSPFFFSYAETQNQTLYITVSVSVVK